MQVEPWKLTTCRGKKSPCKRLGTNDLPNAIKTEVKSVFFLGNFDPGPIPQYNTKWLFTYSTCFHVLNISLHIYKHTFLYILFWSIAHVMAGIYWDVQPPSNCHQQDYYNVLVTGSWWWLLLGMSPQYMYKIHIYTQSRWWFQPILQRIGGENIKYLRNHHLPAVHLPQPQKNTPPHPNVPCFTSSQDGFRWSFDESVWLSDLEWLWSSKEGVFKVTSSGVSTCRRWIGGCREGMDAGRDDGGGQMWPWKGPT